MTEKEISLREHLRRAGSVKSEAKTRAARENAKLGGYWAQKRNKGKKRPTSKPEK